MDFGIQILSRLFTLPSLSINYGRVQYILCICKGDSHPSLIWHEQISQGMLLWDDVLTLFELKWQSSISTPWSADSSPKEYEDILGWTACSCKYFITALAFGLRYLKTFLVYLSWTYAKKYFHQWNGRFCLQKGTRSRKSFIFAQSLYNLILT